MRNRSAPLWAILTLILVLVMAGCAPRAGTLPGTATLEEDKKLVVDLPALVVDIALDGTASIGNVPVSQLANLVGVDPATLSIPQAWVDYLISSNIQHVQVNNTQHGLLLLVNGEAIPSISYVDGGLNATAYALSSLGMAVPMLDLVLPMVERIGMGVIVRFPLAEGQAGIPLYVEGDGSAAALAQKARQAFLASVDSAPRIDLPIFYEADGSWMVGDLTDTEWMALTNLPVSALRLNPTLVNGLADAGLEELAIHTDSRGIRISVNGHPLPTLTWANGEMLHLLRLADQLGLWSFLPPGIDMAEVTAMIDQLLPVVTSTDFDLTVHMPRRGLAVVR